MLLDAIVAPMGIPRQQSQGRVTSALRGQCPGTEPDEVGRATQAWQGEAKHSIAKQTASKILSKDFDPGSLPGSFLCDGAINLAFFVCSCKNFARCRNGALQPGYCVVKKILLATVALLAIASSAKAGDWQAQVLNQ